MNEEYILIVTKSVVARIKVSDILYIERAKRKIHVVTALEEYEYYERIENVEPFLDGRFFPCLKGCYVNLDKVTSLKDRKIFFEGEKFLLLGRENFLKTVQYYKIYAKNQ